jgi:MscS family membrane protein
MSKRFFLICILVITVAVLSTSCGVQPNLNVSAPAEASSQEAQVIISPTPKPTATPGPLDNFVTGVAISAGLQGRRFLGLTGENWINLVISLLIVAIGFLVIAPLAYQLFHWVFKRTWKNFDRLFLVNIRPQLIAFIGLIFLQFATLRLNFLPVIWKQWMNQIYSTLYILILAVAVWKLVDFSLVWYRRKNQEISASEYRGVIQPVIRNSLRIILIFLAVTMILNVYGVNITGLVALLGIGGLAISLAAQDTLSDIINGFIILFDQPYRIGDRIEIQEMDTWGDVVEIGTRTTRIRTLDNKMVIVPNSIIGKSQVVNYSYPDPIVRVQADFGVAYGTDIARVYQITLETVRKIDGVLSDKPVDVLLTDLGSSALQFRVRWWINSYTDFRFTVNKTLQAMYDALREAGIQIPFNTYTVNMHLDPADIDRFNQGQGSNRSLMGD